MADRDRSKEDLIRELDELRKRLSELESGPTGPLDGAMSRRAWEQLAQRAPVGIFITQDAKFVYTNPMMTELTGYSSEELHGTRSWDLVHPDMKEIAKNRGLARLRGETVSSRYELKCLTKNRCV